MEWVARSASENIPLRKSVWLHRIFKSSVKSVLLYLFEKWSTVKSNTHKLQIFVNRCLGTINIRQPDAIYNTAPWDNKARLSWTEAEIRKKEWEEGEEATPCRSCPWIIIRQALNWNPQAKTKMGRPRPTWRLRLEADVEAARMTWVKLKMIFQSKVHWSNVVSAWRSREFRGPTQLSQVTCCAGDQPKRTF